MSFTLRQFERWPIKTEAALVANTVLTTERPTLPSGAQVAYLALEFVGRLTTTGGISSISIPSQSALELLLEALISEVKLASTSMNNVIDGAMSLYDLVCLVRDAAGIYPISDVAWTALGTSITLGTPDVFDFRFTVRVPFAFEWDKAIAWQHAFFGEQLEDNGLTLKCGTLSAILGSSTWTIAGFGGTGSATVSSWFEGIVRPGGAYVVSPMRYRVAEKNKASNVELFGGAALIRYCGILDVTPASYTPGTTALSLMADGVAYGDSTRWDPRKQKQLHAAGLQDPTVLERFRVTGVSDGFLMPSDIEGVPLVFGHDDCPAELIPRIQSRMVADFQGTGWASTVRIGSVYASPTSTIGDIPGCECKGKPDGDVKIVLPPALNPTAGQELKLANPTLTPFMPRTSASTSDPRFPPKK